jgi:hypothetical protein
LCFSATASNHLRRCSQISLDGCSMLSIYRWPTWASPGAGFFGDQVEAVVSPTAQKSSYESQQAVHGHSQLPSVPILYRHHQSELFHALTTSWSYETSMQNSTVLGQYSQAVIVFLV